MVVEMKKSSMKKEILVSRLSAREYTREIEIPEGEPTWELVHAILSQNTSSKNYNFAFKRLTERFPSIEELALAPLEQIEEAIRPGGLSKKKSTVIKGVLEDIRKRTGGYSLDLLADINVDEARKFLTSLPGVGAKTASVVLLFGFGRDVLPVDTHVLRIAKRVGLVDQKTDAVRAESILEEIFEPPQRKSVHLGLVRIGREICYPRKPLHEICPLAEICDFFQSENSIAV